MLATAFCMVTNQEGAWRMGTRYLAILAALAPIAGAGGAGAGAESATPVASPASGAPTTMTLVERGLHITTIDLGEPGASVGDMIIWGPDPLYDATNTTDTGATTQGACVTLHNGDCLATETIVFPDGSTLQIQGIQAGAAVASTRTIIGGSGRYRGATGTLTVQPTAEKTTWMKTFMLWP
jgi:hypothetical protein